MYIVEYQYIIVKKVGRKTRYLVLYFYCGVSAVIIFVLLCCLSLLLIKKTDILADIELMNHKGGYTIHLSKPPAGRAVTPSLPDKLFLGRKLDNVTYDQLEVEPGQIISAGQVAARSSDFCGMPLLASVGGVVAEITDDYITISDLSCEKIMLLEASSTLDMLLQGGCYRYIRDPFDGGISVPGEPENIIVKLVEMDCYLMADEIELMGSFEQLSRGIDILAGISKQKLYIVVSKKQKNLYSKLSNNFAGNGKVQITVIADRYGLDSSRLLAEDAGFESSKTNWNISSQGVMAVQKIIEEKEPSTDLWFSLAGPAVKEPCYYNVPVGYPISELLDDNLVSENVRVINGGVFSGTTILPECKGLAGDVTGITVLDNTPKRKLLKFARFGLDNTRFDDNFTTDMQGELRACVSCGYCQKVCPAGLLPDYLHKLLYNDDLDRAEAAGLSRCVGCGLCSFICVSKIDLASQFKKAQLQAATEKGLLEQGGGK